MSGAAGTGDPSMEDILASIRRILDEDPAAPLIAAEPPPPPPPPPPAAEIRHDHADELLLDASMLIDPPQKTAAPIPVAPPPPPPEVAPMSLPPDPFDSFGPVPEPDPPPPRAALLGAAAADETTSSVKNLMRAVATDRTTAVYRDGPTIEDLVREELRPLLKTWLDNHLPPLVERLVRGEIERVMNRAAP